jgi:hypothetical protein
MRDLIRKVLREQVEKYDTYEMLRTYKGPDKTLQDIGRKLRVTGKITKKEFRQAISQFKKEYYATSILDSLSNNSKLQDYIKKLGIQTYNGIIRTNKKKLLDNTAKIKVSQPEREWIRQNVSDLIFFKNHIEKNNEKFDFPDRNTPQTVTEEAFKLIRQLGSRDFWGFIENDDWSILNRLNTNYTNWIKLIAKKDVEGLLNGRTVREKIEDYFKEKPMEQIHDLSKFSDNEKKLILSKVPNLSYADSDIIALLISADDSESDYDFNRMYERIKKTTEKGEDAERKFYSDLISNGIPKADIKVFSSFGNLVDITFQCDMMVKINGKWIPVQIKSSESKYSKLLSYNIGGLLIYPAPQKFECGNWVYYDGKSLPKSFDEEFLNISC